MLFPCAKEFDSSKIYFFLFKSLNLCEQWPLRRVKMLWSINNVEDTNKVFPKDWFILGKWVNFQSLMEKGFIVKGLFYHVGGTPFWDKFSS